MRRAAVKTRKVPKKATGFVGRRFTSFEARRPMVAAISGSSEEVKFFDTTNTGTALATTGVITNSSLNLIPQGILENNRIGRKCTIKKIQFRGVIQFNSSTTESGEVVRIMVVWDKQANGAAATITDILETADEKSFNNLSNKNRFVTLKDWYFPVQKTVDLGTNINES